MPMKELITYIAQALVDNPDAVAVTEVEGAQTSVIDRPVRQNVVGSEIDREPDEEAEEAPRAQIPLAVALPLLAVGLSAMIGLLFMFSD